MWNAECGGKFGQTCESAAEQAFKALHLPDVSNDKDLADYFCESEEPRADARLLRLTLVEKLKHLYSSDQEEFCRRVHEYHRKLNDLAGNGNQPWAHVDLYAPMTLTLAKLPDPNTIRRQHMTLMQDSDTPWTWAAASTAMVVGGFTGFAIVGGGIADNLLQHPYARRLAAATCGLLGAAVGAGVAMLGDRLVMQHYERRSCQEQKDANDAIDKAIQEYIRLHI